jgi:hypothetical protein
MHLTAHGLERQFTILPDGKKCFLVGWPLEATAKQLLEHSKRIVASWDS